MREILFRAKIKDTDEWVEGYYAMMGKENLIRHYIVQNCALTGLFDDPEENMYFNDVEIDPKTLCQFTGFTDKNGKQIWENDIVKYMWFGNEEVDIVEYRSTSIGLKENYNAVLTDITEVIGNIFDNPEYLGK